MEPDAIYIWVAAVPVRGSEITYHSLGVHSREGTRECPLSSSVQMISHPSYYVLIHSSIPRGSTVAEILFHCMDISISLHVLTQV